MRRAVILLLCLLLLTPVVYGAEGESPVLSEEGGPEAAGDSPKEAFTEEGEYEKALILDADEVEEPDVFGNRIQKLKVRLLSGKDKGKEVEVENEMSTFVVTNIHGEPGDKILVYLTEEDGGEVYKVADYYRSDILLLFVAGFILLLVLVGGKKGFFALLSLIIIVGGLLGFGIPMILKGYNPIYVAVLSTVIITVVTLLIIGGISVKTFSAILGTIIGVAIAGVFAYLGGMQGHITGMTMDEAQMLTFLPGDITLNPRELLFAGIIWGSLGAIMDVGMSIASAIEEVKDKAPNLSFTELFKSGMNVGRDVMGTMSNTLILAYLGSALPLILMIAIWHNDPFKVINLDTIVTEGIRSLSGSIGIILSIPLTAVIAAGLFSKKR